MLSFSEWCEQREIQEGSLGLQRRDRVARGMANRAKMIDTIYPNDSDSRGHLAHKELENIVKSRAGRFSSADERMQRRSEKRLARIANADKIARKMQAGQGNMSRVHANLQASSDANAALAGYARPEDLAQRGVDPNWRATTGLGRKFSDMEHSHEARQSKDNLDQKRILNRQKQRDALERKAQRPPKMKRVDDQPSSGATESPFGDVS